MSARTLPAKKKAKDNLAAAKRRRAPAKRDLDACLADKAWRINNLYLILAAGDDDEDEEESSGGKIVPFEMRDEQHRLLMERHTRNFIPKARKEGISTVIVIDYLDSCIFADPESPKIAAHVDFTDKGAMKKLRIAKRAWEQGPRHPDPAIADIWRAVHEHNPMIRCNDHELAWANGSIQTASTSVMGDTINFLHISEFGPLAAQQPAKAADVKRGSLNAVPKNGIIDIETTMEGGPVGDCYDFFMLALANEGRPDLSPLQWKMFFIPWMKHPAYILRGKVPVRPETNKYFDDILARYGVMVPPDRQAWYEQKKAEQGWDMFTQFPTVLDECLIVGSGAAYFDGPGLLRQREIITPYSAGHYRTGDIIIQGDVKNVDARSALFMERPNQTSPFVIIEHPIPGCRYILPCDFCVGKQAAGSKQERDTNAFLVVRDEFIHPETRQWHPAKVVASCQPDDRSITTETIRRVVALSIYYGDCMVMPEINNKDDIALRLMAAGVRTMWRNGQGGVDTNEMPGTTKTAEVWGWLTQDTAAGGGTRSQMLDVMREMTMQQKWICSFPWILDQMGAFAINKKGRAEAAPGKHDDFVTSTAMGLFGLPHATKFKSKEEKTVNEYRVTYARKNADPRGI